VSACGGGDPDVPGSGSPSGAPTTPGAFTLVVSFGDSLSDLGAYTPATSFTGNGQPPFLGGKFTTNIDGGAGLVWVENVANAVLSSRPAGTPAITPAEVGFAGQSQMCPIATSVPALAGTCTGYGQAGSRVSNPDGYKHSIGFLTVPATTQVANHLARFGSFKDSDLVLVSMGFNEVFVQFEEYFLPAFMAAYGQWQAGQITENQFKAQVFQAQVAAQEQMKIAALELADLVRTQILAKGAKYVAVTTLLDMSRTPEAMALPEAIRPMLNVLPQTFELWLREGLTGQPVRFVDLRSVFDDMITNPAGYGFVDVSSRACDATKMPAASGGSSLFCNTTPGASYSALAAGADVNTWLFADGVHPTVGGYKAVSGEVLKQLKAFGWI
jgi:outer membrane lipase/esterase